MTESTAAPKNTLLRNRWIWLWIGACLVILVALTWAVLASGGDDDGSAPERSPTPGPASSPGPLAMEVEDTMLATLWAYGQSCDLNPASWSCTYSNLTQIDGSTLRLHLTGVDEDPSDYDDYGMLAAQGVYLYGQLAASRVDRIVVEIDGRDVHTETREHASRIHQAVCGTRPACPPLY